MSYGLSDAFKLGLYDCLCLTKRKPFELLQKENLYGMARKKLDVELDIRYIS